MSTEQERPAASAERRAGASDTAAAGGGDPACWLDRICPDCGRVADRTPDGHCPECGAAWDTA